jgi:hypothetical protein
VAHQALDMRIECQWVRPSLGGPSEPCVELRHPHGADGGRQATANHRGDR